MRSPWSVDFPEVAVHADWQTIAAHPQYAHAKEQASVAAAAAIVEANLKEEVLQTLFDDTFKGDERPPLVVIPGVSLAERRNALSITFGGIVAQENEWQVAPHIFQERRANRDRLKDGWYRLTHQPSFYGHVEAGRNYVLADDVLTMGGTLASLRGFIESKGGTVIGMTALASGGGGMKPIALSSDTQMKLNEHLGGALDGLLKTEVGYGIECLTEAEGLFLLRCTSVDQFRKGANASRNG